MSRRPTQSCLPQNYRNALSFRLLALLAQVISSFLAGSAIGALTGSGIADSLGRRCSATSSSPLHKQHTNRAKLERCLIFSASSRKGLMLSSVPLALGATIMAVAQNFAGIAAGRFVTGLGVGLSSCMVPIYIAEVNVNRILLTRD